MALLLNTLFIKLVMLHHFVSLGHWNMQHSKEVLINYQLAVGWQCRLLFCLMKAKHGIRFSSSASLF
jgi:hypothetical protein